MTERIKYNAEQLKAVTYGEGPLLVTAGPGSGKTAVITGRIRYILETLGADPHSILVLTFSVAAAGEMKKRFSSFGLRGSGGVTFGTFHSFFLYVLKTAYGYTADRVISEEGRREIIYRAVKRVMPDLDEPEPLYEKLKDRIALVKSERGKPEDAGCPFCRQEDWERIFGLYEEELGKSGMIDYEDMAVMTHGLFSEREDIRGICAARYRWILIDEFQDIDLTQYEIIHMLAGRGGNITAVGDDDQSIYGFRGARPEFMLKFTEDHPGAAVIRLSMNYRCSGEIVYAAGKLIGHNRNRIPKTITSAAGPGGMPVRVMRFKDETAEVEFVLSELQRIVETGKDTAAVLARKHTLLSPYALSLSEDAIPYRKKGEPDGYGASMPAGDISAYLRLAHAEGSADDLLRVINRPDRNVKRGSMRYITDVRSAIEVMASDAELSGKIRRLACDLEVMGRLTPYEAVYYLRKEMGYDRWLDEYCERTGRNICRLKAAADEYQRSLIPGQPRVKDCRIFLDTFHGSKGLEYDHVYIIDVCRDIVPDKKAVTPAETEEERRALYVAMTRAARELTICCPASRHGKACEASPFTEELEYYGTKIWRRLSTWSI